VECQERSNLILVNAVRILNLFASNEMMVQFFTDADMDGSLIFMMSKAREDDMLLVLGYGAIEFSGFVHLVDGLWRKLNETDDDDKQVSCQLDRSNKDNPSP
jgi:hypothetical protein